MDALFPPGPQKSLFFGDAPHFKHNPLDYMMQSARTYGDLVHFRFGPSHAYLLTNPRDAHEVLVERADQFAEQPSLLRALNSAMGHDLFAPKEKVSKRTLRRASFKLQWLDPFVADAAALSAQALDRWQGGDPLAMLQALTLELVTATLFGSVDNSLKEIARRLAEAIGARRQDRAFQSPLNLPAWIPTRANRQQQRAASQLPHVVAILLADHRIRQQSSVLTDLFESGDNEAWALEEMLALFRAGQEAAATLASAWAYLARNPDAAAALQAEANAVLGGRMPAASDLPDLVYAEMVFKETLRLNPPVWLISRQAKKETRLGDYFVPTGSTIFISPHIIHHSPRYYTSPEHFLPERFGESLARRGSTYAYLPFGAGIYAEVERDYATAIGKLVLASMAQRFRLAPLTIPATAEMSPEPLIAA